jgi:phosphatidylinositol glycan class K
VKAKHHAERVQFDVYNPVLINSHPGISHELSKAKPDEILVTDFFGGVANVEVTPVENTLSPFGRNPIKWEASAPKKHKNTIGDSKAFLKKTAQQPHVTKPRGWQSPLHTSASSVIDYAKGGLTVIAVSLVAALLWRSNANPREGLKED